MIMSHLANQQTVGDHISDSIESFPFKGRQENFLPRPIFMEVTAFDVIQRIVSQDDDMYLSEQEQAEFTKDVYQHARKLFAACVYSQMPMTFLKVLLDSRLSDANMPLTLDDVSSMKDKRKLRNTFLPSQKLFNTAFFHPNSHQKLHDGISIPIHFDEEPSNHLGKGAYGDVWSARIHHDHHSLTAGANKKGEFAIKVTQYGGHSSREEDWNRNMAQISHPNLLKCQSSFIFSSKYHMVYEKADCDLEEFIRRYRHAGRVPITGSAFARQLYGLASALQVIHNQESSASSTDPDRLSPDQAKKKTGYIHDIKPENILVFIYDDKSHLFRLSDFSCAKVSEFQRDSHITGGKKGTPIYRAPESLKGKISRPFDLWSLGCVYLELLVWYFEGYEAVEDFRENRRQTVRPTGAEDEGFYFTNEEGENARIQLRTPVANKIQQLSARCKGELKAIADVIPLLLKIQPKERLTAKQLVKRLEHLCDGFGFDAMTSQMSSLDVSSTASSPVFDYRSESDSDFGGMVKVTRPSNE